MGLHDPCGERFAHKQQKYAKMKAEWSKSANGRSYYIAELETLRKNTLEVQKLLLEARNHLTLTKLNRRNAVIYNPDYAIQRKNADSYSKSVKLYTETTYWLIAPMIILLVSAIFPLVAVGFNLATPVLLALFGLVALKFGKRINFISQRDKYCITEEDFGSKFLVNTFKELESIPYMYEKNIAVVDKNVRDDVKLDEHALRQHVWKIAVNLKQLGNFYDRPRSELSRTGDLLENALHDVRAEIAKLKESVQNLTDIAVVSTTNSIRDSYIDPTVADNLAQLTRDRLTAHRELEAPRKEIPEEIVLSTRKLIEKADREQMNESY